MSAPIALDASHDATPISHIATVAVEWLWPSRLAFGHLAMLDGDPGLGKSLIALDLCARLTTGRPFPEQENGSLPANVLIFNAEDANDTIRGRLQALDGDLDRAFIIQGRDDASQLRFPSQVAVLEAALAKTGARLVVIDPIPAFLDSHVIAASDRSVRAALGSLTALARSYHAVVLLVRHFNKRTGLAAVYRGGGSIAFAGICRSAWMVAPVPNEPGQRVFAQVKNNLAPPQSSLGYTIAASATGALRLSWLGPSSWTADSLLASARQVAMDRERERARRFLEAYLRSGYRTSREARAAAQSEDISYATLKRAKADLKIQSIRLWARGQRLSYWLLEGQTLPEDLQKIADECDLEPYLEALRAKYPPESPLDDD